MSALVAFAFCLVLPLQGPSYPSATTRGETSRDWKLLFQSRLVERGILDYMPEEPAAPGIDARQRLLYVGGRSGVLRCLDADTGREQWRHETKAAIRVTPLLLDSMVLFGNMDGRFYALDRTNGRVIWETRVGDAVVGDPVVVGDRVLFIDARGTVQALDLEKGVRQWRIRRETIGRFTIVADAGIVASSAYPDRAVAGFPDGHLLIFDPQSGETLHAVDLSGGKREFVDVDATPLLHGDLIIASSWSGGLYGVDITNGTVRWHVEGSSWAFPTRHAGQLLAVKDGQKLFRLDAKKGAVEELWVFQHRPVRDLRSVAGVLWMADGKSLHRLDLNAPGASERFTFLFGVSSAPAALGSALYFLSDSGYIYGVELL